LLAEWKLTCGVVNFSDFPTREFGQVYQKDLISLSHNQEAYGVSNCLNLVLEKARSTKNRISVLTHGFNNTFSDAISRAKSFADDVKLDDTLVIWSWPSQGAGPTFYSQDEKAVAWSGQHFTEFFQFLLSKDGVTLDFFAHSMGNHLLLGLVQALKSASSANAAKAFVFAAPDVDQGEFEQKAATTYPHFYTL